jgi:hypothetical protein
MATLTAEQVRELDPYAFLAVLGKRVIHPGGRGSTDRLLRLAAVEKRINPSTGRLDRSGEKNLNPFDTHAIEAAMQIMPGGSAEVEEVVAVSMGPESAVRALHKRRAKAPPAQGTP